MENERRTHDTARYLLGRGRERSKPQNDTERYLLYRDKQQNGQWQTFCSLVRILPVSVANNTIECMNQALPFGLKRKIDKLPKWESKLPADRNPSDHVQRLESRAGSLSKQSYRKIGK
jgi:hypothetical protein